MQQLLFSRTIFATHKRRLTDDWPVTETATGGSDMDAKNLLKTLLFVVPLNKAIVVPIRKQIRNQNTLKQLRDAPYPQGMGLKQVLERLNQPLPPSERNWISRIEDERTSLLSRAEPLNDGSLGEGGLYDDGQTVKSACEVSKPPGSALILYRLTRATMPRM